VDLWVKGLGFEWEKLYGDVKPQRISLPTYPFAQERYWITKNEKLLKNSIADHSQSNHIITDMSIKQDDMGLHEQGKES
jgi:acyl transferase domain-containing protein